MEDFSSGVYQVGDRLPNEQEMCDRFGVSRVTVREAYRALTDDGYLSRRHGTGTFVARVPNRHSLDLNLSYTAMIQDAGYTPSVKVVQQSQEVADEDTRELLQLDEGDKVLLLERVRYADDRPVVYSIDRVPLKIIPTSHVGEVGPSLFEFLENIRRGARNGRAKLLPVLATARESQYLSVPEGVPLLFFDEVDYDMSGQPVVASREWHTSNVFEMWINRRAQVG
ncbi:GntR family transcriptional regulator [Amycolatopsis taiwanensis]|uniref:GntR family transcriptional regulator n=2 Tax=Amycolatopsis taiwanensis TaxID=342230 RepID=A0A9W6QY08_9PSEU|nr:GntR family transcriptional regulator [Amycolatopsis taiwanensis]